ncbi:hypothetical protein KAR91_54415 [Candidatus Pacearchaeota archaeon]|nr:hypothetical protein [Candidatus Pacearchaeota archaeon]
MRKAITTEREMLSVIGNFGRDFKTKVFSMYVMRCYTRGMIAGDTEAIKFVNKQPLPVRTDNVNQTRRNAESAFKEFQITFTKSRLFDKLKKGEGSAALNEVKKQKQTGRQEREDQAREAAKMIVDRLNREKSSDD